MMTRSEALKRAIKSAGSVSGLAEKLGISTQAVWQWKDIPLGRIADVHRVTGIPHEELRPDVFTSRAPAHGEDMELQAQKTGAAA